MQIDENTLTEIFGRFNRQIFNSELLPVNFVLVRTKTTLGQFRYPVNVPGPRKNYVDKCSIRISTLFNLPADRLEDLVIHEMIHYFLWLKKIKTKSPHDENFRAMMKWINTKFDRNIAISEKNGTVPVVEDNTRRWHIFCVTEWKRHPERLFITHCSRITFVRINNAFVSDPDNVRTEWYVSMDPWFNNLKRFRTPKAQFISFEDYEEYVLRRSKQYRISGNVLSPAE